MNQKQSIPAVNLQEDLKCEPVHWYVIQRTGECECEWWTGTKWSVNENDARQYLIEPDASIETQDESAKVQMLEE